MIAFQKSVTGKEFTLFFRERANIFILALLVILLFIAAFNGVKTTLKNEHTAAEAITKDTNAFNNKVKLLQDIQNGNATPGEWNDPRKAHQGVLHVKRPVSPWPAEINFLSAENTPLTPSLLFIGNATRHKNPDPVFGDPSQRLDGPFDITFITVWLLPLVVILLGYDVLSRDMEIGSAKILATQNTSLRVIVIRRLCVRFVTLFSVIALTVLVSFLFAVDKPDITNITGLFIWLLAVGFYLGFWFSLTALINAYIKVAATTGQALLALWAVFTFIVPIFVGLGVQTLNPPIDRFQTILDLRALTNDLNQHRDEVTNSYYAKRGNNGPAAKLGDIDEYSYYFINTMYPQHLAFDERYRPLGNKLELQRIEQAQGLRIGAFFSPGLAIKLLSDDLAGETPERRHWFLQTVDRYQNQWRAAFDKKISSLLPMTIEDYQNKPEYLATNEPFFERWTRVLNILFALIISFCFSGLWAWRALGRITP